MPLLAILKALLKAGALYGISEALLRGEKARLQIKRVVTGIVMVMVALFLIYIGLLALASSFFFFLADLDNLVRPALLTGLAVVVISVLIMAEGYRSISK